MIGIRGRGRGRGRGRLRVRVRRLGHPREAAVESVGDELARGAAARSEALPHHVLLAWLGLGLGSGSGLGSGLGLGFGLGLGSGFVTCSVPSSPRGLLWLPASSSEGLKTATGEGSPSPSATGEQLRIR